jgi:hypothetical protein
VSRERFSASPVAYGLQPQESTEQSPFFKYVAAQMQRVPSAATSPATVAVSTSRHWHENAGSAVVYEVSVTTGPVVLEANIPAGNKIAGLILVDESMLVTLPIAGHLVIGSSDQSRAESRPATNPILEMSSARRSLRDKAREVMSDFERDYPW